MGLDNPTKVCRYNRFVSNNLFSLLYISNRKLHEEYWDKEIYNISFF